MAKISRLFWLQYPKNKPMNWKKEENQKYSNKKATNKRQNKTGQQV